MQAILSADEIYGFLIQRNISTKNVRRLHELESINDESFQQFRLLVLEIALAKPRKRRRWIFLREQRPNLMARVVASGWFEHFLDEMAASDDLFDEDRTQE